MKKWHMYSTYEILEELKVDRYRGISDEMVLNNRKEYGENIINFKKEEIRNLDIIKNILFTKYNIILFMVLVLNIYFKNIGNSIIVGLIGILNIASKLYFQKEKMKVNIDKVDLETIRVIRNGTRKNIIVKDLVVGDIVDISKGEVIPADIRILESEDITVNEKSLTGEDFISEKYENKMQKDSQYIGEIKNILYKGSVVVSGSARGIVVATGNNTELGNMFSKFTSKDDNYKELEKEINENISKLTIVTIVLSSFIVIVLNMLGVEISNIINCLLIPYTFIYSIPVVLMWKNIKGILNDYNISLINPSILINFKRTNILIFDKIRNACSEEMNLEKIYMDEEIFDINDIKDKKIDIERIFSIGLLCNNSKFNIDTSNSIGDSMEVAILKEAANNKIYKSIIDSQNERIFEIPLEWDNRIMTTLNKCFRGYRANCKGTVDRTLELSVNILKSGITKDIELDDIERIKKIDMELSKKGYTTLALAYRNFNYLPSKSENITNNLTFVGILAFKNDIEVESKKAIDNLKDLGIRPIMVCDDNKISAFCLAKEVGITKEISEVISGVEINSLTDEELYNVIDKIKVFSRISPEIKIRIVDILKKKGESISFSGDQFVDLALLNAANCAIATDKSHDLVKRAADFLIKGNMIKGFINLVYYGDEFVDKLHGLFNLIYVYILSEIMYIATSIYFFDVKKENIITIVLLNNLIVIPIINYIFIGDSLEKYKMNKFKGVFISIIIGTLCSMINFIESKFSILFFIITFVFLNMIFYIFNCKEEKNNIYYF